MTTPWSLTAEEYAAEREKMFDAGDAAAAPFLFDSPGFTALIKQVDTDRAQATLASKNAFDAPAGLGAVPIMQASARADSALSTSARMLAWAKANGSAAFLARQQAHVQYAKANLASWIEAGAIQLHEYERGSPLLTVTFSHEDVVRTALDAGMTVPGHVLSAYPALVGRVARTGPNPSPAREVDPIERPKG